MTSLTEDINLRTHIFGSGLIATAFKHKMTQHANVAIFASGVSNSQCTSNLEFKREEQILENALLKKLDADYFVYFSTCSILDVSSQNSLYVQHKIKMENFVKKHPSHMIVRLPQVAGKTKNPNTLLNYIFARIMRQEKFTVWGAAERNIIDVDDIANIVIKLIENNKNQNETINVANACNHSVPRIIAIMEEALDKRAKFDVIEKGSSYYIDIQNIRGIIAETGIIFDDKYLLNVIEKYYKNY